MGNRVIMDIGDVAMYGSCKVRISSVRLRGTADPYYRFSCVEREDHDHPEEWGDLASHRLIWTTQKNG